MKGMGMSWINPKLEIGKSSAKGGIGVFTKEDIKKGEVIAIFGGHVISLSEFKNLPEELKEFPYHVSDDLLFGPIRKKNIGIGERFNHSCYPNAGFKDSITLVAMRNIKKNEEITFDYATCMTSAVLNLKCLCGEKNCRKKISGNDWKKPKLQSRYKGYFIPYIQEKIDKMKNK